MTCNDPGVHGGCAGRVDQQRIDVDLVLLLLDLPRVDTELFFQDARYLVLVAGQSLREELVDGFQDEVYE